MNDLNTVPAIHVLHGRCDEYVAYNLHVSVDRQATSHSKQIGR